MEGNASVWNRAWTVLKDIFFPLFCFSCKKEGSVLCQTCIQTIEVPGIFLCPVCTKEDVYGNVCVSCAPQSFLDSHIALFSYTDKSVPARLIHDLKYNYIESAVDPFAQFFSVFFQKHSSVFSSVECVAPVPLHPRRFAERGFNQSDKIVCFFEKQLGIPIVPILKRTVFTRPQVGLSFEHRKKNVQGIFSLNVDVQGKCIMLVDDVYTTGSTLQECAKVLKENGAKEVHGFSLARAVSGNR